MRILILGGTGFIGQHLYHYFLALGHSVKISSRQNNAQNIVQWDGQNKETLLPLLENTDAVINLLGANIAKGRWTKHRKHLILNSRINSCKALTEALKTLHTNAKNIPKVIIQASGCGFYGLWDNLQNAPICTETSIQGKGFLAEVCAAWEQESQKITKLGIRHCTIRIAAVLGKKSVEDSAEKAPIGGFLASMITPFKLYLGGPIGSGAQPLAWVHINDLVRAIYFLICTEQATGIFNLCSQKTISMNYFVQSLAKAINKPALVPAPAFALKLILGEMASELILSGQNVSPKRLLDLGFIFDFPSVNLAIKECVH